MVPRNQVIHFPNHDIKAEEPEKHKGGYDEVAQNFSGHHNISS